MKRLPETDRLTKDLLRVGHAVRRQAFLEGVTAVAGYALFGAMAFFLIDYLTRVPYPVRLIVLLSGIGYGIYWFKTRFYEEWRKPVDAEEVSLLVEKAEPELQSRMISTLQFQALGDLYPGVSANLVDGLVTQTFSMTGKINFNSVIDTSWVRRRLPLLGGAILLVAVVTLLVPSYVSAFAMRLVVPGVNYPTRTKILDVDIPEHIPQGDAFTIRLHVGGEVPELGKVVLHTQADEVEMDMPADPRDPTRFSLQMPPLDAAAELTIHVGDAWHGPVDLIPVPRPHLKSITVNIEPPSYTGEQPREEDTGTVRVPAGSKLSYIVESTKPLKTIAFDIKGSVPEVPVFSANGNTYTSNFIAEKSFGFTLSMIDENGLEARDIPTYHITVAEDRAPTIQLARPRGATELAPISRMPMEFTVKDDFAVTSVAVKYHIMTATDFDATESSGLGAERVVEGKPYLELTGLDKKEVTFKGRWENAKTNSLPGQLVRMWIEATDNAPTPHTVRSPEVSIRVITREEYRNLLLMRLGERMERADHIILDIQQGKRELEKIKEDAE